MHSTPWFNVKTKEKRKCCVLPYRVFNVSTQGEIMLKISSTHFLYIVSNETDIKILASGKALTETFIMRATN